MPAWVRLRHISRPRLWRRRCRYPPGCDRPFLPGGLPCLHLCLRPFLRFCPLPFLHLCLRLFPHPFLRLYPRFFPRPCPEQRHWSAYRAQRRARLHRRQELRSRGELRRYHLDLTHRCCSSWSPWVDRPGMGANGLAVDPIGCRRERDGTKLSDRPFIRDTGVHGDTADRASRESNSAGGMTTSPNLRNRPAPTVPPPRRRAISHRMVAREPVTDRLGPRSTPIRIAPVICAGTCAAVRVVAAIKPIGRLFTRFDAIATTMPAIQDAACGERLVASFRA